MSYMRALCPYTFVDGESEVDYVYSHGDDKDEQIYGANMKNETAIDNYHGYSPAAHARPGV